VKLTFSRKISLMGFLGGCKVPQPMRFSAMRYACAPLPLKEYNAHKTRFITFVWFSNVLGISRLVYNAKIFKSVIIFYAINMIYKTVGPPSGDVKPRQPMRFVYPTSIPDCAVADSFFLAPCLAAFRNAFRRTHKPDEFSGLRVVAQYLFKFVNCHILSPIIVSEYIHEETTRGQV